ncbi:MAG: FkbM family methyltransferase [Candidatus Omnitrophota bacterium]
MRHILRKYLGDIRYQKFFEKLHTYALEGMNCGGGAYVENSGEAGVVKFILKKIADSNPILFDVGASIGKYTSLIEGVSKEIPGAIIYSFEPSRVAFDTLLMKMGNKPNISLHRIGFGDCNKKAKLFYDVEGSELSSLYRRRIRNSNSIMNLSEEIEIRTIDSFCAEKGIGHIHLLKLDVEGYELCALQGAQEMLRRDAIDFIQFEFSSCNIDSKTYFQDFWWLLNDTYKIYRVVKNGIYPIGDYDEKREIFSTTNYVAERKNIARI